MQGEELVGLAIGTMAIGAALKGLENKHAHHHKRHFTGVKIFEGKD